MSDSRRERMRFSARNRTWLIVLRGGWGRAIDRFLVRWTGFSLITWQYATAGGRPYTPTLLLTTIGAKTGRLRSSALPYWRVGDDLVVCGTNGGGATNPLWVGNIAADPHCWLSVNRKQIAATGRVAEGEERARLFEHVAERHVALPRYQEQASTHGREVPLVVLTPRRS